MWIDIYRERISTNTHTATLDAFWRQDGAYQTPASRGYVDWNAKFIQAMVERFEPIEASFQSRSNEIFEELEILVGGNLSELEVGLRGTLQ
jgi:hypothetical protein